MSDNHDYQAAVGSALRGYTRGFVMLTLVDVPIACFVGPSWVSMVIDLLACLGAIVQLAFQWAVLS